MKKYAAGAPFTRAQSIILDRQWHWSGADSPFCIDLGAFVAQIQNLLPENCLDARVEFFIGEVEHSKDNGSMQAKPLRMLCKLGGFADDRDKELPLSPLQKKIVKSFIEHIDWRKEAFCSPLKILKEYGLPVTQAKLKTLLTKE
jgi:hypothetical protein